MRASFGGPGATLLGGQDAIFGNLAAWGADAKVYALSGVLIFEAIAALPWGGTWPTRAGYVFVPDPTGAIFFTALSGSHAATLAYTVGTNATSYDNIVSGATVAFATLNQIIAAGGTKNSRGSVSTTTQKQMPEADGTLPHVNITTAVTNGTTCRGQLIVSGSFAPLVP